MAEVVHDAKSVYGVGRDLPLNYAERAQVDPVFRDNLTRDKHVVIYGSSKQGKTSLRKKWLQDDDYVVVSCLNTMSLSDLHGAILKQVGYRVEQSSSRTVSGSHKVNAEFRGKGKVPFLASAEGGTGYAYTRDNKEEVATAKLELELADVNDIITALSEIRFDQYIILEDFHYLPSETQQNFSFALKAFHENSPVCFIVVGVWRDKNRLVYYNGDLNGRVVSIDADEWAASQLEEVISAGEALMNVTFDQDFRNGIIEHSFDAVYLVQEACLKACANAGVEKTSDVNVVIGANLDAREVIKAIVNDQAGRYSAFMDNFSEGFQTTGLEMYKWLLCAVISSEQDALSKGLRRAEIAASIKKYHPEGATLNEGNITQALQNTASLQVLKNVRPLILDYDQTIRVLNVVDRSFLIWLAYQDREEILSSLGI